ncbi:putative GPI-anchored protein 7 [Achaetomium macrosporum]|uniref:GPI-anchored protein 7 n=1 Tax=Achaetomium macrosporum TaxID=79813 RepID=A0AAN7C2M2_9PEZI|nr:putative GPI-anchored protein 7 [Achaetomium macrosporum]
MKIPVALISAATVAASAAAESLSTYLPACSIDCLTTAIGTATTCKGPEDLECFCIAENYRAIYDSGVACVLQACGNDVSVGEVLPAATHMCEVVVARSGSTVTSVGYPASTANPSGSAVNATTATSSTSSPTTSTNAVSSFGTHALAVVAPLALAAVVNL